MSTELPVTTRHRRDMTDNIETDVKPEQTNKLLNVIERKSHFFLFFLLVLKVVSYQLIWFVLTKKKAFFVAVLRFSDFSSEIVTSFKKTVLANNLANEAL